MDDVSKELLNLEQFLDWIEDPDPDVLIDLQKKNPCGDDKGGRSDFYKQNEKKVSEMAKESPIRSLKAVHDGQRTCSFKVNIQNLKANSLTLI
jgi:hypothetical protein